MSYKIRSISRKEHIAIIIPGLSDGVKSIEFFTRNWYQKFGLKIHVHVMPWKENNEVFEVKLQRLLALIDFYTHKGSLTSLIGISGGGSAALNAFIERPQQVHRVINDCGRIEEGVNVSPSLEKAGRGRPTFIESVQRAEQGIQGLDLQSLQRIMTLRPRFGDEVVPTSTVTIEGAKNITIPTAEHMISIVHSLLFPQQIINFLTAIDD